MPAIVNLTVPLALVTLDRGQGQGGTVKIGSERNQLRYELVLSYLADCRNYFAIEIAHGIPAIELRNGY